MWPAQAAWEQALNDMIYSLAPDGSPRFRDRQWQQAFAAVARAEGGRPALFSPLEDGRVYWTVQLTPDALWKRLCTLSQIANLPAEGPRDEQEAADSTARPTSRKTVRRRLDAILARDDVARDAHGEVTIHALTYFAWAQTIVAGTT